MAWSKALASSLASIPVDQFPLSLSPSSSVSFPFRSYLSSVTVVSGSSPFWHHSCCGLIHSSSSPASKRTGQSLSCKPFRFSFTKHICRAAEYKFPDPIPEFADAETEKFRTHLLKKLSKKDIFGDSVHEVVEVCTEILRTFLHTEYGGPGTLLVIPFIDMADTLNEKDLPGAHKLHVQQSFGPKSILIRIGTNGLVQKAVNIIMLLFKRSIILKTPPWWCLVLYGAGALLASS